MTRVKSVSSPPLLLALLVIAMVLAIPIIPWADTIVISGTGLFVFGATQVRGVTISVVFLQWLDEWLFICTSPHYRLA